MKICAFDPGVTTGYAVGILDEEKGEMVVKVGQEKWTHLGFYNSLVEGKPDITIHEKFEYRNRARPGLELVSREYIGVLYLYIQQYKVNSYEQMPALVGAGGKSGPFSNNLLQHAGFLLINSPHAMDALRHLLYWYQFGSGFQYNKIGYVAGY